MLGVVNCVAYRNGERIGDVALDDISEVLKQEDSFVWLGLLEPNAPLLAKIQQEFGLHELAIEDAQKAHQRPKLEEYGDSLFMVLRTAQWWEHSVHLGETHIFVGRRFLISIRHGPSMSYTRVRERCEAAPQRLAKGPAYAVYALMDFVVDNYGPIVEGLRDRLEGLESNIFKGSFSRDTIEQLYELKRELLELRSAAAPLLDVCNELMRFHSEIVPKDMRDYFRDIHDHVKRVVDVTDTMREMVTAAMQVNLALVSVGQNEVVKRLAGWGAILAIPTMVFSLYGMNFRQMPELEWTFGYPAVLAGTAVACVWLFQRLKAGGWL